MLTVMETLLGLRVRSSVEGFRVGFVAVGKCKFQVGTY